MTKDVDIFCNAAGTDGLPVTIAQEKVNGNVVKETRTRHIRRRVNGVDRRQNNQGPPPGGERRGQ